MKTTRLIALMLLPCATLASAVPPPAPDFRDEVTFAGTIDGMSMTRNPSILVNGTIVHLNGNTVIKDAAGFTKLESLGVGMKVTVNAYKYKNALIALTIYIEG